MNQGKHKHRLKDMYEAAGISKQAHTQYMKRRELDEAVSRLVTSSIHGIRSMHSMMGLKKIYKLLSPDWIGRDRFIRIGMEYGLGAKEFKNFQRTTFSTKSRWFINLTAGLSINDINQVWVSDITYFRIGDTFYYLTFVVDVYSRRILGYTAATSLRAEANCEALKAALNERSGHNINGLIHHSDRGSQYVSNEYLKILSNNKIAVSMCDSVYENSHIERINGIIKKEYLECQNINTFKDLKSTLKWSVQLYNNERPHWSLNLMTPVEFENELKNVPIYQRSSFTIFSEPKNYFIQQSLFG